MYPYPYDQPTWTESDQKYWFNMVRKYRYPVTSVRAPYQHLIKTNQDATWQDDYAKYLLEQAPIA
jgi:hypothetical protein